MTGNTCLELKLLRKFSATTVKSHLDSKRLSKTLGKLKGSQKLSNSKENLLHLLSTKSK